MLGRSRAYILPTLPERQRQWHAPRVNRWENLRVTGDSRAIECVGATGATGVELHQGEHLWFAAGKRWRVARMATGSCFELEIHADVKGQAWAPQPVRSSLPDILAHVGAGADALLAAAIAWPITTAG